MSDPFALFGAPAPDPEPAETVAVAQDAFALLSEAPTEGTDRPAWHQLPTPLQNLHGHFELPPSGPGQIVYHHELIQGSDEWAAERMGVLTASEMHLIVSPSYKPSNNEKGRSHVYEIAAQRCNKYVEPSYYNDTMLRGHIDEVYAKEYYGAKYAAVTECGFITNTRYGVKIGYSPDGLVGENGLLECKSRRQGLQFQALVECVAMDTIPSEHMIQCQTGLLVTEREWLDYISYCGGMEMSVVRVYPDTTIQAAIIEAAISFEARVQAVINKYHAIKATPARLIMTERRVEQEITL